METPKLVIDKEIAKEDSTMAAMFGSEEQVFSSSQLRNFLDSNKGSDLIELEIICDGGSTTEAKICFDMLNDFKSNGGTVITKSYKANSSAVVLMLAGTDGHRSMSKNCEPIIHPVWIDPSGLPFKMEADDLIDFGNEIKKEETKLIDIYCSVIGEDNRNEVTELMKASTSLTSEQCVRLGFINEVLDGNSTTTKNKSKAYSYSNEMESLLMNKYVKNQTMTKNEFKSGLDSILESIKNLLPSDPKNATAELKEGGAVYYDGELAEGTMLYTDEAMQTPAPDGEHELADGKVVTVAEGKVTGIKDAEPAEPENKEVEALNTKIEELETTNKQLLESQKKNAESLTKLNETVSGLVPVLEAMKNFVPGDEDKSNRKPKVDKPYAEMSNKEKMDFNKGR